MKTGLVDLDNLFGSTLPKKTNSNTISNEQYS
jgi:hypothetical protein